MPYIRRVPQDYASVAAAQSAANAGDIIHITGKFSGTVPVTKAVHFVGAGGLTDTVFSLSTANGLGYVNSSSMGILDYNLSAEEAAKVPFLLVENLALQNTNNNAPGSDNVVVRLLGSPPVNGIFFNRCRFRKDGIYALSTKTAGWRITLDRSVIESNSVTFGIYSAALGEGHIDKCQLQGNLPTADLAQNWLTKDYVTVDTAGYGPVPTGGIVLRWEDLDFEAYRIYGTVTDIPTFVDPADFEIRLYPEKTPQGNDMGFAPLEMIPLSLIETVDNKWSGSWEFKYLLPTRRYGILINPPDGMQGHWLRWYNPAVE